MSMEINSPPTQLPLPADPSPAACPTSHKADRWHSAKPSSEAIERLKARLRADKLTRLALNFLERFEGIHLKDEVVEWMDDRRRMRMCGQEAINFGSDSFLGLDRDPRLREAMNQAAVEWGTHNGASRAFGNAEVCEEAERRLARWLGVQDTLIYPSVTMANNGMLPAIAGKGDLLVLDRMSHDSLHQAAKIAAQDGAKLVEFNPCTGKALRKILKRERHKGCVVCVDGIYSMTGDQPPLAELDEVTREFGGLLYVDDAHGTAVVGPRGHGAAEMVLGTLDNIIMAGSLSKAFSCMGGFVTCDPSLKRMLKIRSSSFVFSGPVPPPYLAAVCTVCDILESPECELLLGRLHSLMRRLVDGIQSIGFVMSGGEAAIVAVQIGEIEKTLKAGKWMFDRGYFVQSATYPAVPILGGLLRMQVNSIHSEEDVDGLLNALADLKKEFRVKG